MSDVSPRMKALVLGLLTAGSWLVLVGVFLIIDGWL